MTASTATATQYVTALQTLALHEARAKGNGVVVFALVPGEDGPSLAITSPEGQIVARGAPVARVLSRAQVAEANLPDAVKQAVATQLQPDHVLLVNLANSTMAATPATDYALDDAARAALAADAERMREELARKPPTPPDVQALADALAVFATHRRSADDVAAKLEAVLAGSGDAVLNSPVGHIAMNVISMRAAWRNLATTRPRVAQVYAKALDGMVAQIKTLTEKAS